MSSAAVSSAGCTIPVISHDEFTQGGPEYDRKLTEGMEIGFFHLEIPPGSEKLVNASKDFANTFLHNAELKAKVSNQQLPQQSGFFDRKPAQAYVFNADQTWRDIIYPADVLKLVEQLECIARAVLKHVLKRSGVKEEDWNRVTANMFTDEGFRTSFHNCYLSKREAIGLQAHSDFGWVTVLYADQFGLQAKIDAEYRDIKPKSDCYVVNFGRALELLVGNTEKLVACWHRVKTQSEFRSSFGIFLSPSFEHRLFQIVDPTTGELEEVYEKGAEYIQKCFDEIVGGADFSPVY